MTDFGITISCYRGDLPLLKGCLESIRSNLDRNLPICLIPHGEFPLATLAQQYNCTVLQESDVDPRLRQYSYGYGWTKMIAFWHSPFERFLHIDADTVCWGDFLFALPWNDFDLIYNESHEVITEFIQKSQYFDPKQVFSTFSYFPWEGSPFFNAGIFMARRGMFNIDEYLDLLAFQRNHPSAFISGEQGILNFLAFRRISTGEIKARSWPFQAVVPVIPVQELEARFQFFRGVPQVRHGDPRLIHWAGRKPYLTRDRSFLAPMVHYRMQHLRRVRSPRRYLGKLGLMLEELDTRVGVSHDGSYMQAAKAKLKWIINRLRRNDVPQR